MPSRNQDPPAFRRDPAGRDSRTKAVLFDRDSALLQTPHGDDYGSAEMVSSGEEAMNLLRSRNVAIGVVSKCRVVPDSASSQLADDSIHRRIVESIGPVDGIFSCHRREKARCPCRTPSGTLINSALLALRVSPAQCCFIGSLRTDLKLAARLQVSGVMVPTSQTLVEDIMASPVVASNLVNAVERITSDGTSVSLRAIDPY